MVAKRIYQMFGVKKMLLEIQILGNGDQKQDKEEENIIKSLALN